MQSDESKTTGIEESQSSSQFTAAGYFLVFLLAIVMIAVPSVIGLQMDNPMKFRVKINAFGSQLVQFSAVEVLLLASLCSGVVCLVLGLLVLSMLGLPIQRDTAPHKADVAPDQDGDSGTSGKA